MFTNDEFAQLAAGGFSRGNAAMAMAGTLLTYTSGDAENMLIDRLVSDGVLTTESADEFVSHMMR